MSNSSSRSLRQLGWVAGSFTALAMTVIALAVLGVISFQLGLLMLVGLVGLYLGGGVLALVYRFVAKLQ